jgi:Cdc6-like AAA superfamily ATPase
LSNKVLVLCGRRGSGKTIVGNFVTGYLLRQNKVIKNFALNNEGKLVVNAYWVDEHGAQVEGEGILDLNQNSPEHISYFIQNVWPHVKCYSMNSMMNIIAKVIFNVGEDKKTHIPWSNLFRFMPPFDIKEIKEKGKQDKNVPHQDFLDILNYEVFRIMDNDFMVNSLIRQIMSESSALPIVADCKTISDAKALKQAFPESKFIWFDSVSGTRKEGGKTEKNLTELREFGFDLVVDNIDRILTQTPEELVYPKLVEWQFVQEYKYVNPQKTNMEIAKVYEDK